MPFELTRRELLVASAATTALAFVPKLARAQAQWQMSTPLPKAMEEIVGVALGKSMYVFGGYAQPGTAYRFDEDGARWTTLRQMPERAHHLMATTHAGDIYIFGGFTFGSNEAWKPTAASFRYNAANDGWTALAPLPRARGAGQAVSVGNKIYVIGGVSSSLDGRTSKDIPLGSMVGQTVVGWVDEYNPATNSWRARASMPTARNHYFAAEVEGRIYALDGRTGSVFVFGASSTDLIEAYDPSQDVWTLVGQAPTSRGGVTGAVLGGRIFITDGRRERIAGRQISVLGRRSVRSQEAKLGSASAYADCAARLRRSGHWEPLPRGRRKLPVRRYARRRFPNCQPRSFRHLIWHLIGT